MTFFSTGPPINGRGATSASGVTAMVCVGDDDIINRGEQCRNGYLLALSYSTTSSLAKIANLRSCQ